MRRFTRSGVGRSLLPFLLALTLLLAACTPFASFDRGRNTNQYYNPSQEKFYQGSQGVTMRFDQMPPRLFYYGDAQGSSANDFPLSVEVHNEGTSYSRGAIFLSGYDPHLIQFDEVPLATSYPGACSLRVGDFSLNKLGFFMQCGQGFTMGGHEGNWLDSISVRGRQWFKNDWLKDLTFNFDKTDAGGTNVQIGLDKINFGYREHGLLLISILSGLSFQKFLGQEYLLAADNYDYPGGEIDYKEFNGHLVSWPEGADEIDQHFLVTNCYMYSTFAAPTVCIDPQPYSTNRKVCNPKVASWSGGQGAPLAITRVTQENTPRHAIFHITIQNVGHGTVYNPGSLEKCSPYYPGGAKSSDLNQVWVGEVRIDKYGLECTPRNVIRLDPNGRGELTCTYPIQHAQLNSAYQTPLVIELWYGYSETMQRTVPVKRIS